MKTLFVKNEKLKEYVYSIFHACGLKKEHAEITAENLVKSNLYGVDSHGVIRTGIYIEKLKSGVMNTKPAISVITDSNAMSVIDGDNATGAIVGTAAMTEAIIKAEQFTVGFCGAVHSNHFGAAGHYVRTAAQKGMIGIAISNVAPLMGMPGIKGPVVGNNPIAFGVPTGGEYPLVFDIALSNVALGKILVAEKEGKPIPEDWAVDKNGNPTTNPIEAKAGSLLPIARHKGFGLALIIDVLTGVLSGGGFLDTLNGLYTAKDKPGNISHLMVAIQPPELDSSFIERMKLLCSMITSKDPEDKPGILILPGKIENDIYKDRIRNGIPLSKPVIDELNKLALEFGIRNTLKTNSQD